MNDILSIELTQEIIQFCFKNANLVPLDFSLTPNPTNLLERVLEEEWQAWAVLFSSFGVSCNKMVAKNDQQICDLIQNIRSFFVTEGGEILPDRKMSVAIKPSWASGVQDFFNTEQKAQDAQIVHFQHWKRSNRNRFKVF